MSTIAGRLERLVGRVERGAELDPLAETTAAIARRLLPVGRVKNAAAGAGVGHPLHPALVAVPIGSWLAAGYLDAVGGVAARPAARRLIALGVISALPTAATGTSDWLDTSGAERRVGLAHAALNVGALGAYATSWLLRGSGRQRAGVAVSGAGAVLLAGAGWLGGHLAFALGVGVDTTAFQRFPTQWTDVGATKDFPMGEPKSVEVEGVAVLVVHRGARDWVALADRCTHRGGPLHEGELVDGCITCPWHGSVFALADGSVRHGPATRPQPVLMVRNVHGRVQVRRDEERSLRLNPVGQ